MSNTMSSGGVLTGAAIRAAVAEGQIQIDPWVPEHVGPNSVDLRLGPTLKVYKLDRPHELPAKFQFGRGHKIYRTCVQEGEFLEGRILDMRADNPTIDLDIPERGLVLMPGILYLGCTMERTASDHYIPKVEGRSSVGRLGIKVHLTAGFGDIGFNGRWTLEIEVTHPIRVYAGERICQVYFSTPHGPIADLYHGRYQGDLEPRPSLFHLPTDSDDGPRRRSVPFHRVISVAERGFMVEVDKNIASTLRLKMGDHIMLGKHIECVITGIESSSALHKELGIYTKNCVYYMQPTTEEGRQRLKQLAAAAKR